MSPNENGGQPKPVLSVSCDRVSEFRDSAVTNRAELAKLADPANAGRDHVVVFHRISEFVEDAITDPKQLPPR